MGQGPFEGTKKPAPSMMGCRRRLKLPRQSEADHRQTGHADAQYQNYTSSTSSGKLRRTLQSIDAMADSLPSGMQAGIYGSRHLTQGIALTAHA